MDDADDDGRPEVDRWVPAGVAYMVIGDELARRMACDPQEGRREAADLLLESLMLETVRATAKDRDFDLNKAIAAYRERFIAQHEKMGVPFDKAAVAAGALERDLHFPEQRTFSGPGTVPAVFWEYTLPAPSPICWAIGDFYWNMIAVPGVARGVEFALCDLPFAEEVRAFMEPDAPAAPAAPAEQAGGPRQRRGGRPASPAWPSFCAEMVAYMLENPRAEYSPGAVSRIADAVLDRLAGAGHAELAPTQAREAVRAVIHRLAGDAGA